MRILTRWLVHWSVLLLPAWRPPKPRPLRPAFEPHPIRRRYGPLAFGFVIAFGFVVARPVTAAALPSSSSSHRGGRRVGFGRR